MISFIRCIISDNYCASTHKQHTQMSVCGFDTFSLSLLHFVSVILLIRVTTGRWKESEWRYTTALCEAKEVDRQVSKKLPASPHCDLWAEWVATGPGEILQQIYIYRIVARFLAMWCKVHKEGVSPWTSVTLIEPLSAIFCDALYRYRTCDVVSHYHVTYTVDCFWQNLLQLGMIFLISLKVNIIVCSLYDKMLSNFGDETNGQKATTYRLLVHFTARHVKITNVKNEVGLIGNAWYWR